MIARRLALGFALVALAAPATLAQTTLRVDTGASRIVYTMRHPTHRWSGTSAAVAGTFTVAGGVVTSGRVTAPVRSFDSGIGARDRNMADQTEAGRFPAVTFEARSVSMLPAARRTAERNATVQGVLTFHGIARPVTVPVRIDLSGGRVHLRGAFDVTLSEFGLVPPAMFRVPSRDWIGLRLDLTAGA